MNKNKFLSKIVYLIVRVLNLTYRYEYHGLEKRESARNTNPQKLFIYAIWHQNIVAALLSHLSRKESFTMIISASNDGELIAASCVRLGHSPARGSSSRGGKKAMVEMIQNMNSGMNGVLTVDGPRGPARKAKFGIIDIARITGAPIIPMCPYPEKYWVFSKTWDQFRIPKPFTKVHVVIGDAIIIPKDALKENYEAIIADLDQKIDHVEVIAKEILKR